MAKYQGILTLSVLLVLVHASLGVRFYEHSNFQGNQFVAPPGWAGKCNNVPEWINDRASSVNTEGHCIIVFEHGNCQGSAAHIFPGSSGHSNLGSVGMNDRVSSFRGC